MTTHIKSDALQSDKPARASWWAQLLSCLGRVWQQLLCSLSNTRRGWLKRGLPDYVVITIEGALLERDPETPWYYDFVPGYRGAQSIEGLQRALDRIADDPDMRGVLFLYKGTALSLAQAQSVTALFERFRRRSALHNAHGVAQRIVVYVEQCSPSALVAAIGCHDPSDTGNA